METENIKKIYQILNEIPVTNKNEETISKIKECLLNGDFPLALEKIKNLQLEANEEENKKEEQTEEMLGLFPKQLSNPELEYIYMGLLLNAPKLIVKYYFLHKECFFEDEDILNLYKSVLFTEGGNYTPEVAKKGFNFAKDSEESYELKKSLKEDRSKTQIMQFTKLNLLEMTRKHMFSGE